MLKVWGFPQNVCARSWAAILEIPVLQKSPQQPPGLWDSAFSVFNMTANVSQMLFPYISLHVA